MPRLWLPGIPLLLGALTMASCGGFGSGSAESLESTTWMLSDIASDTGGLVDSLPGVEVTASFFDAEVSGDGGCNRYFGTWVEDGSSIEIGPLGSTRRLCGPEIDDQEARYLGLLESAVTFQNDGQRLTLFDDNRDVVLAYDILEPTQLIGTDWEAISVNNGQGGVVSLVLGSTITAVFGEDGNLTGNGGCNGYSAAYETTADSMRIGVVAATRQLCTPDEVAQQEAQYFEALSEADVWSIVGDRLELRSDNGELQVSFQSAKG